MVNKAVGVVQATKAWLNTNSGKKIIIATHFNTCIK